MSEEKIDVKKLTISKAITLFLEGKISKKDLKESFDKDDLFKLNSKQLEDVLYKQKKESSFFPKELRIKSEDILYQYGRQISAGQLMNLASKGYVSERDVLKALKKNTVITLLVALSEEKKENDKKTDSKDKKPSDQKQKKSEKSNGLENDEDKFELEPIVAENNSENIEIETEPTEEVASEPSPKKDFSKDDILDKETVKSFFSVDRLIEMFFAKKMTREFTEAYEEAFKQDEEFTASRSKEIIKKLKEIFKDNLQALFIVVMRLYFKGMVFTHDVEDAIKAEFFTDKTFDDCEEYDVIDKDGKVIYSYKKSKKNKQDDLEQEVNEGDVLAIEEGIEDAHSSVIEIDDDVIEEPDEEISETFDYFIMEPLTEDEIIDAYRDSKIDGELFKKIFTMEELLDMYKYKKISIKVFSLFNQNIRKSEILKAYKEGYIHLEEIMELFFYYDGISAKELKSIINEMPQKVSIIRFITINTGFEKIFELYKNKLIDFNMLCLLKYQDYISEIQFKQIRGVVDKEEFYDDIKTKVFYTSKILDIHEEKIPMIESEEVVPVLETYEEKASELEPDEDETPELEPDEDKAPELELDEDEAPELELDEDETPVLELEEVEKPLLESEDKKEESIVEISDSERVLLTKVLGISEEEIQSISLIESKDENGNPTMLDGYQVISDKTDGLVIFGKFDYSSPIFVMTYEEASYFFTSKEDEEVYISNELMFVQRLENNEQIRVVEHDDNMGKTIVQALCDLSETARSRYIDDEQYMLEVNEYIRTIDEKYREMVNESNNNM